MSQAALFEEIPDYDRTQVVAPSSEVIAELKEELAMRKHVYASQVANGKMTKEDAAVKMHLIKSAIEIAYEAHRMHVARSTPLAGSMAIQAVRECHTHVQQAYMRLCRAGRHDGASEDFRARLRGLVRDLGAIGQHLNTTIQTHENRRTK